MANGGVEQNEDMSRIRRGPGAVTVPDNSMANARVHQREVLMSSNVPALSVEQRKLLAKERIAKLKAQRLEKQINQ